MEQTILRDGGFYNEYDPDKHALLPAEFNSSKSASIYDTNDAAANFLIACGLSIDFGDFGGDGDEQSDTIAPDEPDDEPDAKAKIGTLVGNAEDNSALDKISSPNVTFTSADPGGQEVTARQLTQNFTVRGAGGKTNDMHKGDWVVTDSSGNNRIVASEEFLKKFTPKPFPVDAPIQKFIKTLPIQAELITKEIEWHNPDAAPGSPPRKAKPGDYWAKSQGQAPYVIPGDYFKANYVQIPGSGEYARTSITQAQVMTKPGSIWSQNSGVTSGEPGDYLITRETGSQEILSAKKFHEQFANAEAEADKREPLSKPKATGPRFNLDEAKGITAEPWDKGLIVYDGKSVIVTDDTTGSSKEYVEGRLARERGTTIINPNGDRVINRTYTYGDLETVRRLPTLDSYRDLLERRPELKRAQELAHSMPMTHHDNSPERVALRAKITDELTKQIKELRETPANDGTPSMKIERGKKLNIVLGLSGSGKSTIANEIAANNHAYIADVDEIKRKLPEWQGGTGAAATAVEAHLINNPVVAEQLSRGDNLVVPVVGANTGNIEKLMQSAKTNGYEISLTLVDIPPTEAMKRIVARLENGGLYVDPNYLSSLGNRPSANFRDLVEKHFVHGDTVSHFAQVSNFGKTPVLVAEGHVRGAPDTSGLGRREFFAEANVNVGEVDNQRRTQMPDVEKEQPKKVVEGPIDSKPLSNAANPTVGEKPIYAAPPNDARTENILPRVELVKPGDLAKITDEKQFRDAVKDLIKQAKEGKAVSFEIDTRVGMTGQDNKPIKATQATILYDELKTAYPDRAFMFTKPDLKPGDKGYSEIPAPKVSTDGLQLSSKENAITLEKELTLSDGKKVPAGSKFAVGTTYDGQQFKSADPGSKVWAITPDGTYMQVAEAGEGFAATPDTISQESSKRGQVADRFQKAINPDTGTPYENHLIVRTSNEKSPDGKPLLDVYPSGGPGFETAYKAGSKEGLYAAKAKAAAHLLLPENITVNAETKYGHSKASGADGTYYMDSGFGDAKDATAKNYTGETDPRSAKEVLRIRAELGMTDATQVEAGLARTQTPINQEKIPETLSEAKELARQTESHATAEKCVKWINKAKPEGYVNTLFELAKSNSRAAIPALQALSNRPDSATEASKIANDRWNSGDLLSMLKENRVEPRGLESLFSKETSASDMWKEAWIGSADSPEAREKLAHLFLDSTESEGSRKWNVKVPDELRRGAMDFVVEHRLPRFEKTLEGATKMEHGLSQHAALVLRAIQDMSTQKPTDGHESKSTKVIDLKESAARTTIADAERAMELRQSNVINKVLTEAGMDEVRAKELERKLTSMDEKERESAVKEIDKHFEEKVVAAESAESTKLAKEGKANEENRLRGFEKFKSKLSEHKGKLATVVVLTAPIVAGMMMKQETNKGATPGSTFSK